MRALTLFWGCLIMWKLIGREGCVLMINLVDIKETLRQFIPNHKLRTEIRKRNVIIYISNSLSMGQI